MNKDPAHTFENLVYTYSRSVMDLTKAVLIMSSIDEQLESKENIFYPPGPFVPDDFFLSDFQEHKHTVVFHLFVSSVYVLSPNLKFYDSCRAHCNFCFKNSI